MDKGGPTSLSSESIFDKAWERVSSGEEPEIIALLQEIEQQLALKPGFLSLDELIVYKLQLVYSQMPFPRSKVDMLHMTVRALSDIKIMDIRSDKLYGDFSDGYSVYKDNHDNIMYRMEKPDDDDMMKLDLDSASSVHTKFYESDIDDTASLMACDSNGIERSPSILEYPVDDVEDKFTLHKVLEELRERHVTISMGFHDIDTKLAQIKEQNEKDLEFLDKLMANNELIRDRMHDMRTELLELSSALLELKDASDIEYLPTEQKVIVEGVNDYEDCMADPVSLVPIVKPSALDLEHIIGLQTRASQINEDENNHKKEKRELLEEKSPSEVEQSSWDTETIGDSQHTNPPKRGNGTRETAEAEGNKKEKKGQKSKQEESGTEIMHIKTNSFILSIPLLILVMAVFAGWIF